MNDNSYLPAGATIQDGERVYENMETNGNAPSFFENILNQTGETIGNAVVGTVQAGATALNTAIANNTPAPAPAPAPSPAISAKTLGLVALGILLAVWAVKNYKE